MNNTALYEVLGVRTSATAAQIKAAYRKRAPHAHPDTGGDPQRFATLKQAYDVLMNPKRRQAYDTSGAVDEPQINPIEHYARELIGAILNQSLQEPKAVTILLVDAMTSLIKKGKENLQEQTKTHRTTKATAEKALKRFKKKTPGQSIISPMVEWQIRVRAEQLAKLEHSIAVHDKAIEMLSDYTFDPEVVPVQTATYGTAFGIRGFSATGSGTLG